MSSVKNQKYNFTGKVALVTGSSSGIGAAIAIQFAQYGAQVTITGRDSTTLAQVGEKILKVSGGVPALQLVGNLRDDESFAKKLIDETVAKFGGLDFLVNNAGAASAGGRLSSANLLEEFDQVYKLNVRAPVELIQLAVPHLEKTKGNVINISSALAIVPNMLVYSSSKAALDMVTKTSALELGPKGIRVNSLNPGLVATPFQRSLGRTSEQMAEMYAQRAKQSLIGRIGEAEDIANLASFLASDDARNITGGIYLCDNGTVINPPNYSTRK